MTVMCVVNYAVPIITSQLVECPLCKFIYRPDKTRTGACSVTCADVLRHRLGIKINGMLPRPPAWTGKRSGNP